MKDSGIIKVSIIVLNYNGIQFLRKCLPSIQKQTYKNIETIVTDNNSTDGSQKYVKSLGWVKILENKQNYGYTTANNLAALKTSGKLLLFLNNDTELFPDAIESMIKCYKPKTVVAPAQIITGNKKRDKVGSAGPGMDIFGYSYVNTDLPKTKMFYVDGAAILIGKKDFLKIGKFDDELFIFHEDVDLSWRAQIFGYKLIRCWESKLFHYSGGNVTGGSRVSAGKYTASYNRLYLNQKNVIRNLIKNYSLPFLLIILPSLIAIHFFEILVLCALGQFLAVNCYFLAYKWNIQNLESTLKLRRWIQKRRTVSDFKLISKMYFAYSKITALYRLGLPSFK